MGRHIQLFLEFWKKLFRKLFGKKPAPVSDEHSTVPFQPAEPIVEKLSWKEKHLRRLAKSHKLRNDHFGTFSPLKPVGRGNNRQPVRFACQSRAFKIAFEKEFGVKLK